MRPPRAADIEWISRIVVLVRKRQYDKDRCYWYHFSLSNIYLWQRIWWPRRWWSTRSDAHHGSRAGVVCAIEYRSLSYARIRSATIRRVEHSFAVEDIGTPTIFHHQHPERKKKYITEKKWDSHSKAILNKMVGQAQNQKFIYVHTRSKLVDLTPSVLRMRRSKFRVMQPNNLQLIIGSFTHR